MNHTAAKTKLVFLPLLFLGIIFIASYSFLYWLFYIQLNMISLKENVVQYWIPVGLSLICIFLLIRPRVHILKLDKDNGRVRTLYYMVGAAAFCIPAIIALKYLDTATGKLTTLNSINEISEKPATKYYTIKSYTIDKQNTGIESVNSYSGKHNQYLNFDIYIAVPFVYDSLDTIQSSKFFLSVKYHKQISSKISVEERKHEWSAFWEESIMSFNNDPIHFSYLERMANTETRDNLIIAAGKSELHRSKSPILILKPVDEPFEERNGNGLGYFFLSFGIGFFVWFIMIIIPGLHEHKAESFASGGKSHLKQELVEAYDIIKPRKGFVATPALIGLNTLVFVIMVFKGLDFSQFYTRDLISWGAIYKPAVQHGEWWRLITGVFLHGGFLHLLMNMISLYLAGIFLERFINSKRFIIGYLLSGIAGGVISIWWHDKPVIAVGASGAIFGLYGILLSLVAFKVFDASVNKFLVTLLACTAGYSLLMGFLSEGVDNSAHIGGLLAGFIIGYFFGKTIKAERENDSSYFNTGFRPGS